MKSLPKGSTAERPSPVKKLLGAGCLFAGIMLGLLLFSALTHSVMAGIKEGLLEEFENETGYTLSYRSVSPSFLRFLEIRDMVVCKAGGETPEIARFQQLRFYYNFFDILFAADKIKSVERIELERATVDVDAERDAGLIDGVVRLISSPTETYRLSPRFSLDGRKLNGVYRTDGSDISIDNLYLSVTTVDRSLAFSLHTGGRAENVTRADGRPDVEATLQVTGKVATDLSRFEAGLTVESLRVQGISLRKQRFHLRRAQDTLTLVRAHDRAPLDFSLSYELGAEELSGSFLARDLTPRSIIFFERDLAGAAPLLSSVVTASGSLRYTVRENKLAYFAELDSRLPVAAGSGRLSAVVSGDEHRVAFTPVRFSSRIGEVEF
ncbi:MAG TPA: hypothetical protein ENN69_05995, partial [Spirochaetia bacterium]|nr:hypothetical protein [Spirochaetia bacterium]